MLKTKSKILLSFLMLCFFPLVASAFEILNSLSSGIILPNPILCEDIPCFIERIINLITFFAYAVAPIMILIGAFYFITSGGSPERVRTAKNTITYTLVGLLVILLSRAFVFLIKNIF